MVNKDHRPQPVRQPGHCGGISRGGAAQFGARNRTELVARLSKYGILAGDEWPPRAHPVRDVCPHEPAGINDRVGIARRELAADLDDADAHGDSAALSEAPNIR